MAAAWFVELAQQLGISRARSVLLLGAGVLVLVVHHVLFLVDHDVYPILLLVGAFGIVLGPVGLISPNVALAQRREGKHLPLRYKVAALGSALLAFAVWVSLWLFVYPTEDVQAFLRWMGR